MFSIILYWYEDEKALMNKWGLLSNISAYKSN